MTDAPIILETGHKDPEFAVIWLHGLGADGHDFEPIVAELGLDDDLAIRFIFPHAPMMPVTINNGYVMRAWYDIMDMDIGSQQDEAGIRQSADYLEHLIRDQITQGIAAENIVLAGFSQGGAVILHCGLRFDQSLAGLMALSTYLPIANTLPAEKSSCNENTSIFMGHGDSDPVVRPELAYLSRSRLEQQGYSVEWHEYQHLQHGVCGEEINHISLWLHKVFNRH